MKRLGQGLLNSDVYLDQVLATVLGDEIAADKALSVRDDLFTGGDTVDKAIDNYEASLQTGSE